MSAADVLSWLVWAAPPGQALSAALIARKLTWREQPALLAFLIAECWIEILMGQQLMSREAAIFVQLIAASGWLLAEISRLSKTPLHPRTQALIAVAILAVCAFHAGIQPWTLDYRMSLFRCDVRIERAILALAITAFRWRVPALERPQESRTNRVYRIGVTAYLVVEAVYGSFVKGGPGMWLMSYTPQRWMWMNILTCGALILTAVGMALALTIGVPGRKRAAKRRDGRTTTGLIEMERAA